MAITIKTPEELELMREAGRLLGIVHETLEAELHEGMTTKDVDRKCEEIIRSFGCVPNFLGLYDYPASVCVSINDEVVHGIPTDERIICDGDIVSLDTGLIYKGYHSDAARTHAVGSVPEEVKLLIERTRTSFFKGISAAREGARLNDIGRAIEKYINPFGYGIVRDLCGHGIGKSLHEDPNVFNFKTFKRGPVLKAGMTLAVEPMINMGTEAVMWMDDEWTVVSMDESPSAHYENTIIITDGEPEILTLTPKEIREGVK